MDYKRIYAAFIKDRTTKQPAHSEYSEEHHILPRCMGGGDERENLIRLTPEDHYFAHLVLAMAHGGMRLWAACLIMGRCSARPETFRWRRTYGLARRRLNAASKGIDAPNADKRIYSFFHEDGRQFAGTRIEFSVYAVVPAASVNVLARGRQTIVYGWATSEQAHINAPFATRTRAVSNGRKLVGYTRRPDLFCFHNRDKELSVIATQKGMINLGFLNRGKVSALCKGTRAHSNGWCLIENEAWAYDVRRGENGSRYQDKKYSFSNAISGEIRVATFYRMGVEFNDGDGRPFGSLVSGYNSSWHGWHLTGTDKPIRTLGRRHKFVNDSTGEIIVCSRVELCRRIGVTPSAITRVIKDRAAKTKGWSLVRENEG